MTGGGRGGRLGCRRRLEGRAGEGVGREGGEMRGGEGGRVRGEGRSKG